MYYKNSDYTARTEACANGIEKYYIRFHGQVHSPEVEVGIDIFILYLGEFARPIERQRKEWRRHLYHGEMHERTSYDSVELEQTELRIDIEAAIKTCTPAQQRRFNLFFCEYSFAKIAELEGCDESSVRESIAPVIAKIKIFF